MKSFLIYYSNLLYRAEQVISIATDSNMSFRRKNHVQKYRAEQVISIAIDSNMSFRSKK